MTTKIKVTDKIQFGKLKGIEIGIIYLFQPKYLNWLIEEGAIDIIDYKELDGLKVLSDSSNFIQWAYEISKTKYERVEYFFSELFTFADLKNSGAKSFQFNKEAYAMFNFFDRFRNKGNLYKRANYSETIFIELNAIQESIDKVTLKIIGIDHTTKGFKYLKLNLDNSSSFISFLPNLKNLQIGIFINSKWGIYTEEGNLKVDKGTKISISSNIYEGLLPNRVLLNGIN